MSASVSLLAVVVFVVIVAILLKVLPDDWC